MRPSYSLVTLAAFCLGGCSVTDEVVSESQPELSIILPREFPEIARTGDAHHLPSTALRANGGWLAEQEEELPPEVKYWDVRTSITPGWASVFGEMRYSGNKGTIDLMLRLWKKGSVLLSEPASGSQGGPIWLPVPIGLYYFSFSNTIALPDDLLCDVMNDGHGRFTASIELPIAGHISRSDSRDDWEKASLPPCPSVDPASSGGSSTGTVHYGSICYVLDHYDAWGEYSYTEVVTCWAVAYTSSGEAPQWEI